MDHRLFAYGTLLSLRVQRTVLGREIAGSPARLAGFRMSTIADGAEVFPNLIPDPHGSVDGQILDVTEEELARVDRYEGDLYARHRVTATDGPEVWVYYA